MKIQTVQRIVDDNGDYCYAGDLVFIKTTDMEDIVQAKIDNIMTTMVIFTIDDRIAGYIPKRARATDIETITLCRRA